MKRHCAVAIVLHFDLQRIDTADRLAVLCVQRCYSAYVGFHRWLFEFLVPFCCLQPVRSNRTSDTKFFFPRHNRPLLGASVSMLKVCRKLSDLHHREHSPRATHSASRPRHVYLPQCIEFLQCDWPCFAHEKLQRLAGEGVGASVSSLPRLHPVYRADSHVLVFIFTFFSIFRLFSLLIFVLNLLM